MKNLKNIMAIIFLTSTIIVSANDIFVDVDRGKDSNTGTKKDPLKTFHSALNKAQPGSTIFILPVNHSIHATLKIKNKKGTVNAPIIIDCMMNTFSGTKKLNQKDWQEETEGSGLFKRYLKRPPTGNRYFMHIQGKMERMGRFTKTGPSKDLKKPEELKDYEWTIVDKHNIFLKLPANQSLSTAKIEEPHLCNGVDFSGECSNITIKNVITKHFWNDGFNIHHNCRNIVFENIAAYENSDDGISAHETCQIKVKNMISIGNNTGFCHVQDAECEHENIYISKSHSRPILLKNKYNMLTNVIVEETASGNLTFMNGNNTLANCIFSNEKPGVRLEFLKCSAKANHVLTHGYKLVNIPEGITVKKNLSELKKIISNAKSSCFSIFDSIKQTQ